MRPVGGTAVVVCRAASHNAATYLESPKPESLESWPGTKSQSSAKLTHVAATTTYADFLQRVRRHRPSELCRCWRLPLFSCLTRGRGLRSSPSAVGHRGGRKGDIVAGNEHRKSGISDKDILEICATYNALETPLAQEPDDTSGTVGALLVSGLRTSNFHINSPTSRRSLAWEPCLTGLMAWIQRFLAPH